MLVMVGFVRLIKNDYWFNLVYQDTETLVGLSLLSFLEFINQVYHKLDNLV